jgi:hypothetical protein
MASKQLELRMPQPGPVPVERCSAASNGRDKPVAPPRDASPAKPGRHRGEKQSRIHVLPCEDGRFEKRRRAFALQNQVHFRFCIEPTAAERQNLNRCYEKRESLN